MEEAEVVVSPEAVDEAAAVVTPQEEAEAESITVAATPAVLELEEAPLVTEAANDERTAEAVEAVPSSATVAEEEQPRPQGEGEAELEPVAAEEQPEGATAESASEGPSEAPPEGPASSEGPGEEGAEEATVTTVASEAATAAAEEVPSTLSLGELPTHVSFTEGELPEPPPLQVGAELGRRISLSLWELEHQRPSGVSLGLGSSPESAESSVVAVETEEQLAQRLAEEQLRREELVEQYQQLLLERSRLRHYNTKLQGKLGELLNKAKGKEPARAELEQHISDREQRYSRYLAMLQDMRRDQRGEMAWFQKQIEAVQRSCDEKLAKMETEWKTYQAIKKEVAVYTMGRRLGGRHAAIKEVDQIQGREESKEKEVTEVRLENIKLKHRIQKLEASLKVQEMLAEGLHLIDFEQLKIENQTYNEKIEERNEELLKLRRRITNTVQILSQVKEKLQFVEARNQEQKAELMAIEAHVAQKREILTKTKQARDKLRMDNQKLQQKCGLLGNTLLLRDFENKVSIADELNGKLDLLKQRHAVLTLTCKGVKKKIRGVKSFLPL
ncbi:cilia- and flagella-associated protein 184 [Pogona vitticeps]